MIWKMQCSSIFFKKGKEIGLKVVGFYSYEERHVKHPQEKGQKRKKEKVDLIAHYSWHAVFH